VSGWAVLSVAGTLLPTAAAVVLGYDAPGGVAVFGMTFAFFALPHALIAVPVATTVAPRVAEAWQRGDVSGVRDLVVRSVRYTVPILLVAGAAMAALSWPIGRIATSFGQAGGHGIAPIAHALVVFGIGLAGYGVAFTMTRVLFNLGDVRRTALLVAVSALVGVVTMAVAAVVVAPHERAAALAAGYGATQLVSAVLLTARVRQLAGAPSWRTSGRLVVSSAGSAMAAGAVMAVVGRSFGASRVDAAGAIAVGSAGGLVVFAGLVTAFAGVRPSSLLLRGRRAV